MMSHTWSCHTHQAQAALSLAQGPSLPFLGVGEVQVSVLEVLLCHWGLAGVPRESGGTREAGVSVQGQAEASSLFISTVICPKPLPHWEK